MSCQAIRISAHLFRVFFYVFETVSVEAVASVKMMLLIYVVSTFWHHVLGVSFSAFMLMFQL